jgi:5-methylcytosine-specific restriction endonuclease McrA
LKSNVVLWDYQIAGYSGTIQTGGAVCCGRKRNPMPEQCKRPDRDGTHRLAFDRNKKKIYATQTVCGICGRLVDFSLKYPHPLSPCIDHIIPVSKGGHPSDLDNLQLAHWTCNRQKSDKLIVQPTQEQAEILDNRVLPQSMDWAMYRSK